MTSVEQAPRVGEARTRSVTRVEVAALVTDHHVIEHDRRTTFRAHDLAALWARTDDGPWRLERLTASGPRVLTSSREGMAVTVRYVLPEMGGVPSMPPSWVVRWVNEHRPMGARALEPEQ